MECSSFPVGSGNSGSMSKGKPNQAKSTGTLKTGARGSAMTKAPRPFKGQ